MSRYPGQSLVGRAIPVVAVLALLVPSGCTPSASPSPSLEPTPSASPSVVLNQELLNQRLTVLVVGLDHNLNTDTLMLASVSADQSEVDLVSLPRDTVDLPLPDGTVWSPKINALYAERGIDELVGAMETLFGLPIDGYAMIDYGGFMNLVDAAEGVTVNPPAPLVDPALVLDLQPGEQVVDAETALGYVRYRLDQDYGRMARQQEVITDLVGRLADPETDVDLTELLAGLDLLETDLPRDDLPTLIEIARRAQAASIERLVIGPPILIVQEGDLGDGRGYVLVPDVEAIRAAVTNLIPPEE